MPALRDGALGRMLMTSRLQGNLLFSIVEERMVDPMKDKSYSAIEESRFLLAFCNDAAKDSLSFLGDKSILIKPGSTVLVHRDKAGKILAMVVVPLDGNLKSLSEISSAIGTSEYDIHSICSNCEMKTERCEVDQRRN
mmetsp:Transcript_40241/g.85688  ORF Transcript_40241/g.85688 Transcript_40241/m.85688 type:complete len:138 (-) Transcript_40241:953-1366(-)